MTVTYQLDRSTIEAAAPVEVGHKAGQFWFSTLHQIGTDTLVCSVVRADDTAQGQWPGELYVSEDGGVSWREDLAIESCGQASVRHDESSTLVMPYELWPASPGSKTDCVAPGTLLTRDGSLAATARDVRFSNFPSLAPYHQDLLCLLHSGNLLRLADGSLLTTLYGKLQRDEKKWLIFAAVSNDDGFTWNYRSTVANCDDAPKAEEGPNESALQLLDNGDLLCVLRVSSNSDLYKSYSRDGGVTWSKPTHMAGMWSVQPRLARLGNGALVLTCGRPGIFLWLCTDGKGEKWEALNLGAHHNKCTEHQPHRFSEAFCKGKSDGDPAISTTYTGIMPWKSDGLIVTYDRLANGWSGAPGPNGDFDRVFSVALKVSV